MNVFFNLPVYVSVMILGFQVSELWVQKCVCLFMIVMFFSVSLFLLFRYVWCGVKKLGVLGFLFSNPCFEHELFGLSRWKFFLLFLMFHVCVGFGIVGLDIFCSLK